MTKFLILNKFILVSVDKSMMGYFFIVARCICTDPLRVEGMYRDRSNAYQIFFTFMATNLIFISYKIVVNSELIRNFLNSLFLESA